MTTFVRAASPGSDPVAPPCGVWWGRTPTPSPRPSGGASPCSPVGRRQGGPSPTCSTLTPSTSWSPAVGCARRSCGSPRTAPPWATVPSPPAAGVGAGVADQVSDDKLVRLFADGATLVLQGLHRHLATVGRVLPGAGGRPRPPGPGQRLRHPAAVARLQRPLRRARRVRPAGRGGEALAHPRARPSRRRCAPSPGPPDAPTSRPLRGPSRCSTWCCARATASTCRGATCTRRPRSAGSAPT